MSNPVRTVAPALPPVTVDEAKAHLRISGVSENGLIAIYLNAAVAHLDGADGWLGRAIMPQTWQETFAAFCRRLRLAVAPLTAVSEVTYYDVDGVEQTVAAENYAIDGDDLVFVADYSFPLTFGGLADLTVTYVAGYTTAPDDLRAAILLIVGDLYENREAATATQIAENRAVSMILDKYRRGWAA